MPPSSPAARAAARRLLARAGAPAGPGSTGAGGTEGTGPPGSVAAVERAYGELADALARWVGPYGFHALLARALVHARADHPALAAVREGAPGAPGAPAYLDGLPAAVEVYGAGATAAGVEALLAAVIDLLGRLIGEDMAVNLVSQALPVPAPDADAPRRTNAGDAAGAAP